MRTPPGPAARLVAAALAVAAAACAPPGAPTASASPAPSGGVAAFVPVAERFVETHRGLKFKAPVKVTYLDDAAFQARVIEDNRDPQGTERDSKELRAARLIPPGTDLQHVEDELLGAGVLGFYDPKTKELVVRGTASSPANQHVLVHELTHALQDQWFGLSGLDQSDPTTEDDAYRALVEGDARRVEDEYLQTLTAAQRRAAEAGGGDVPADVPAVLDEILSFPYLVGPPFTEALLAAGGRARLDAAFTTKRPRYTAEVLHPDRYLAGFVAAPVSAPAAGGTEFDDGIFGEEDLLYLLERVPARLGADALRTLAGGWRGDHYVAFDTAAGLPCLRVAIEMDSASRAQQLAGALRPAAGYTIDALAGSDLTWTSCAAG